MTLRSEIGMNFLETDRDSSKQMQCDNAQFTPLFCSRKSFFCVIEEELEKSDQ